MVPPPKDKAALCAILGAPDAVGVYAGDGSSWWCSVPTETTPNSRALGFFQTRPINRRDPMGPSFYGTVLYLSADETNVFLGGPRAPEPMVPILGKTYDVKEKLKAIGARWDPDKRVWKIAASRLQEAQEIVKRGV